MRVLIVDPSRTVTVTLATLFVKFGCEHCAAGSGQEALSVLERQAVDLLCFTYELPDMNGIDSSLPPRRAGWCIPSRACC